MTGSDTEVYKVILTAEVKFLSIEICINLESTRKVWVCQYIVL